MTAEAAARDRAEELGQASFPASDPPAVWTWDVAKVTVDHDVPDDGSPEPERPS